MAYFPTLGRTPRSILACALSLAIATGVAFKFSPPSTVAKDSPFVFIDIDGKGHGSGTHVGGGYFITAGHVTNGAKLLTIRSIEGYSYNAEILWQNTEYDVSLLYVKDHDRLGSVPMSCAENHVGQNITITGNPLDTLQAKSWGKVSGLSLTGLEDRYDGGMWKKLITLDITAAPGVSGAGIINDSGQLVGILVAGAVSDRGVFPYTYGVGASTICKLLARS